MFWFKKRKGKNMDNISEQKDGRINCSNENDIVKDSYYLINLFHNNNRVVTQLQLQKLMFLFEAYYMNKENIERLYDCEYHAWNFGPVAIPLYKKFSKYGRDDITLEQKEIDIGNNIQENRKSIMNEIYNTFGKLSALDLVKFTHAEGSPWSNVWNREKYGIIPKTNIKEWFKTYIKND